MRAIEATHPVLGTYSLYCEGDAPLLFTENETNNARLFPEYPNPSQYVKDGINDCVVHGRKEAVNPEGTGSKAAPHHEYSVGPGQSVTVRLRLTKQVTSAQQKKPASIPVPSDRSSRKVSAPESRKPMNSTAL